LLRASWVRGSDAPGAERAAAAVAIAVAAVVAPGDGVDAALLLGGGDGRGLAVRADGAARRGDPRERERERATERDGRRGEAHPPEQRPARTVIRRGLEHGHQRSPPE